MRGLYHEFDECHQQFVLTAIERALGDDPFVTIMDEVHDPIDDKVRWQVRVPIAEALGL